jgi:hypothetical protein
MNKTTLMIAAAAVLTLGGCGGDDTQPTSSNFVQISTTAAVAPPTPPPTPAAPQTTSVNIQTYERLSTVAHPTSSISAVASLIQETVNVETPKSADEYSQLYVNKLGFQPFWYPYTAQDSTPIQIGLYKADIINRQPNFTKAIIPHDAGGGFMNYYNGGYFPTTFDRIKNIGGNNVVYADSAIIKTMDVNAKSVTLTGKYFPPDQVILDMGNLARSRGMDFTVMTGIYSGDELGGDIWDMPKFYAATSKLSDNDPFWDAWFNAYKPILAERAALAQRAGATRFVLGFNMDYMIDKGNSRWIGLIQAVRAAGFTGKISYFSITNGSYNGLLEISDLNKRTAFIKLFDEFGLSLYNPIVPDNNEVLAVTHPRTRIIKDIKKHIALISATKVPVFLMIGTPSVHNGLVSNDYVEPFLRCSYFTNKIRDYQIQADIYQSAAEIVNEQGSDGSGIVKGIFSWGYHYTDNPKKGVNSADTCYDFSASIRNKPAEAVLSYWFKGW